MFRELCRRVGATCRGLSDGSSSTPRTSRAQGEVGSEHCSGSCSHSRCVSTDNGTSPAHARGKCRDAQRCRNLTWRMYCLPYRHVSSTCQSLLGDDRDLGLCFNVQQLLQHPPPRTWSCPGKEWTWGDSKHEHHLSRSGTPVRLSFTLTRSFSSLISCPGIVRYFD